MNINIWLRDRKTKGTLAEMARRILASDRSYRETEVLLRRMYVLEALVRHGGNHVHTAKALGVHRLTIGRVLKDLGVGAEDVCAIAKHLSRKEEDGKHHGN